MSSPGRAARDRLEALDARSRSVMGELKTEHIVHGRSLRLFHAGLRQGRRRFGLFGRDLLITASLLKDPVFLADSLRFVAASLGQRRDERTGEEPGRGMHEADRVEMRGRVTHYNAVDVTPLFLCGANTYLQQTGSKDLLEELAPQLGSAIAFVKAHFRDGLFVEDPALAGGDGYALRATYWKDSHLPGRSDPVYPVCYTLVQAMAIQSCRAAAELARSIHPISANPRELERLAQAALTSLQTTLWDGERSVPIIALDARGQIRGVSSDMLHMLAYLRPEDLSDSWLSGVERASALLETPYGYRTYAPGQIDYDPYHYHLGAIWPFEQAVIALGATAHGLLEVAGVAQRIVDALEEMGFPELIYWADGKLGGSLTVEGQGCDVQLWTLAVPRALLGLVDPPAAEAIKHV